MARWPWYRAGRHQAPGIHVVQPRSSPEEDQDWVDRNGEKFAGIAEAKLDVGVVLRELDLHVAEMHDGDSGECDAWCWPHRATRLISRMSARERTFFLMVVLKDWYWRQEIMNVWAEDSSADPESGQA